jgi:hypothetical protein
VKRFVVPIAFVKFYHLYHKIKHWGGRSVTKVKRTDDNLHENFYQEINDDDEKTGQRYTCNGDAPHKGFSWHLLSSEHSRFSSTS